VLKKDVVVTKIIIRITEKMFMVINIITPSH